MDIKLTFGHVNPVGCRRSSCSFFLSLSVLFCLRFCLVLFYLYIAFLFVVGCCSEFLFLGRFTNSSYQHHPELKNKKKKGKTEGRQLRIIFSFSLVSFSFHGEFYFLFFISLLVCLFLNGWYICNLSPCRYIPSCGSAF